MSSAKTPKTKKPSLDPASGAAPESADLETSQTALSKVQRAFLTRAARFLVNIKSSHYVGRASRNGYTTDEHAEGWRLWTTAAGADRSLDHWFTEQQLAEATSGNAADRLRVLQDIDSFENLWFPRVRAVIRRKVPRASRDAFAAAFFTNLEQQPLGPTVVASVRALLHRIRQLETSKEPGARQVHATLVQRGLTPTKLKEIDALLHEAESGAPVPKKTALLSPAKVAAAQAAQQEAYEDLKDWFADIGAQLRPVFNLREQLNLGLLVRHPRGAGVTEELTEDEESDEEPSEDTPSATPDKPSPASPKGK